MLKFHPLKEADLAAYDWAHEPLTALLPEGEERLRRGLAADDLLLTVFDEAEKPIGMLILLQTPTAGKPVCAVVEQIVLLEPYRRHKIGRMLLSLAAGAAVERGIWFLAAEVPADNEAAQGFAEAMHFRKTPWYDEYLLLDLSDVEGMRHG